MILKKLHFREMKAFKNEKKLYEGSYKNGLKHGNGLLYITKNNNINLAIMTQ